MILEKSFPAMGTVHTVTIFDAKGPEAASDARAYLLDLHGAWSCFMEDSLVSRINQAAGRQPVAVDEDTFEVLRQAKRYGRFTEGAFDVTVGPLADLWRRAMEERQLPGDEAVWQALALVNFANVTLDEEAHTVLLEKAGQRIDLGGIAKGYAVDELRKRLRRHGVHRALLDLGGTVAALGCGLPVGIREPYRGPQDRLSIEKRSRVRNAGGGERRGPGRLRHRRPDPGHGEKRTYAGGAGHGRRLRDGAGPGVRHQGLEAPISSVQYDQYRRRSDERRIERRSSCKPY